MIKEKTWGGSLSPKATLGTPQYNLMAKPGGGGTTLKGGTGMSGGFDPLFMPLLPLFRPPVAT